MHSTVYMKARLLAMIATTILATAVHPQKTWALASNNIPLNSPVYDYLDKLVSLGLVGSDFKGIRPITKAEAARLLVEAEKSRVESAEGITVADQMVKELKHLLDREMTLRDKPETAPLFDARPVSEALVRYVYLNGVPRNYERSVHDPGGDGVFGIGAGLRPDTATGSIPQHGSEGTPLLENNEGVSYGRKSNIDVRFSSEAFIGTYVSALVEPMFLFEDQGNFNQGRLNKGYAKLGGGGLELEVGRDANWLGLGNRGNITLTNNAVNFDLVKLSSPEPIDLRFIGALKYAFIFSRFDDTVTSGQERHPYFVAAKLSVKPISEVEIGLNLGRQVGGPGVKNSLGDNLRGLVGGTDNDNSNSLAGFELRLRLPFLRNAEIYGEFSGEDAATFWPIVESYVGGIYIPRLTDDGSNDFRFEYFKGNNVLYTNGTYPEGYIYRGMPIGHSQGGAAQEFFFRLRHWFAARNNAALEFFHTDRGKTGRLAGQAVEEKNSWRAVWNLPLYGRVDANLMYGWERVNNLNLVEGIQQTNKLARIDLTYRY